MRRILTSEVIYYPLKTEEIAQMRQDFGLSVEACAKYVHCDPKTWRTYETGKAKIPRIVWEMVFFKMTGRPPQTPKKPTLKGTLSCDKLTPMMLFTTL